MKQKDFEELSREQQEEVKLIIDDLLIDATNEVIQNMVNWYKENYELKSVIIEPIKESYFICEFSTDSILTINHKREIDSEFGKYMTEEHNQLPYSELGDFNYSWFIRSSIFKIFEGFIIDWIESHTYDHSKYILDYGKLLGVAKPRKFKLENILKD